MPRNDIGAGDVSKRSQVAHTCEDLKVSDVMQVGPAGGGIDEIGNPFELRKNLSEVLKLIGGKLGRCGETADRDYWDHHGQSLGPVKGSRTSGYFKQDNWSYQGSIGERLHRRVVVGCCILVRTATRWRGVTGDATRAPPWAAVMSVAAGRSDAMHAADDVIADRSPTVRRPRTAATVVTAALRSP